MALDARSKRRLDPGTLRHPTQPLGRPVETAARGVVAGIPEGWIDIAAVDTDGRRAGEPATLRDGRIGHVDVLDHRPRGELIDQLAKQRPNRLVVRAVLEPEKLDSRRGWLSRGAALDRPVPELRGGSHTRSRTHRRCIRSTDRTGNHRS